MNRSKHERQSWPFIRTIDEIRSELSRRHGITMSRTGILKAIRRAEGKLKAAALV